MNYMTTRWLNLQSRVNHLKSELLVGEGAEWAKALCEELDRMDERIDSLTHPEPQHASGHCIICEGQVITDGDVCSACFMMGHPEELILLVRQLRKQLSSTESYLANMTLKVKDTVEMLDASRLENERLTKRDDYMRQTIDNMKRDLEGFRRAYCGTQG
jgi:hypothetical protein